MDFFQKLESTVTETAQQVSGKAKELAAVANLKSQINTNEEVIKKNYMEIGRIYYEAYGDCAEEMFEKQCKAIAYAKENIKNMESQISDIKGV